MRGPRDRVPFVAILSKCNSGSKIIFTNDGEVSDCVNYFLARVHPVEKAMMKQLKRYHY